MGIEDLIRALTDSGGWVAALAVVVSLTGGFFGLVRPWTDHRRERLAGLPALRIANLTCEDPPPWSQAGKASFELVNAGGGRALLTELRLTALAHGPCDEPKMVEVAAPVPVYNYKVTLAPDVADYDVRRREFGTEGPHQFDTNEVESVTVELRSTEAQWYRICFIARWYDARKPAATLNEVRSPEARIVFRPDAAELLS